MEGLDKYEKDRVKMVKTQIESRGIRDPKVLNAFLTVKRHLFVEEALRPQSHNDYPLPIGSGQTISQPYIVALMTEGLDLKEDDRVLEIGTGSGYQTAILAEIAKEVYSVERIKELSERTKKLLKELGYTNIEIKVDDGTTGWAGKSPFDAIIVTAASPDIPRPLTDQLKEGGRMVIPVGGRASQDLIKVMKKKGKLVKENLGGCRFVKLIGEYGWRD
ncbi:MAG: protein-L-isoaspartate(D-aspartate) O-methyltransferase [Deltaproteobacteria bacterium]|uniref:Protein-L-isoaspartate O-methyltransferase n=1 Tax=Candidatus Zymogenus saltonus TaxID=2844893 RepID=A0A9D8KKR4_9DELT|nr:protein-L-isoaspartate(D-aspartate) O-methyltransferase [Candidatus Zymogenus saltonus]